MGEIVTCVYLIKIFYYNVPRNSFNALTVKNTHSKWSIYLHIHFIYEGISKSKKHIQRCSNHQSSGKSKLKSQCDTSMHLLKQIKLRRMTISCAGNDVNQKECIYIEAGNTGWQKHFGKEFRNFLKS